MDLGWSAVIIVLVLIALFWLLCQSRRQDDFTLPFAGGYVYDPGYGGMADKEVEADSLMT